MTFIRRFIALILLLAWVPASSHCLLAAALQDAVVDCCGEAKQQSGGESHHDSGCCPFCGTFESGKYLTSTKDKQDAGNETQLIFSPVGQLPLKTSAHTAQSFIPLAIFSPGLFASLRVRAQRRATALHARWCSRIFSLFLNGTPLFSQRISTEPRRVRTTVLYSSRYCYAVPVV